MKDQDQDQDRPPYWGPALLMGLALWAIAAILGWLILGVVR